MFSKSKQTAELPFGRVGLRGDVRKPAQTAVLLLVLAVSFFVPGWAAPHLAVTQLRRHSWASSDHTFLQGVLAIEQTKDGYIWIGTTTGLLRFDGARFVPIPLSDTGSPGINGGNPTAVRALLRTPQDELLVSTGTSLIRLGADRTPYRVGLGGTSKSPSPPTPVGLLFPDRQGNVWAAAGVVANGTRPASQTTMFRVSGGALVPEPWAAEVPSAPVQAFREDEAGVYWLGTREHLCFAAPPRRRLTCEPFSGGVLSLSEVEPGKLLVVGTSGLRYVDTRSGLIQSARQEMPELLPRTVWKDSTGHLWIGTLGKGLIRVSPDGGFEAITRKQGLLSDLIEALFEDSAGGLWVGSASGLDYFSRPVAPRIGVLEGLSGDLTTAVLALDDGSVWVGTAGGGVNRIRGKQIDAFSKANGLASNTITSLAQDAQGRLWVGSTQGLAVFDGRSVFHAVPAGDGLPLGGISALVPNGDSMWAIDSRNRVLAIGRLGGKDTRLAHADATGAYRLRKAPDGALWIGHIDGTVSRLESNRLQREPIAADVHDPIRSMVFDSGGDLWVCTRLHVAHRHEGTWKAWGEGFPGEPLHGLALARNRIWVLSSSSIFEFNRNSSSHVGAAVRHDLQLGSNARGTSPRLSVRGDELWLASDDGAGKFEFQDAFRARASLNVAIEEILADGIPVKLRAGQVPAFHATGVQVHFTVTLSGGLTPIEQFRYRLDGLNSAWSPPSSSRTAAFVNLGPGNYRFCATLASSSPGGEGAESCRAFRILPKFYQTWWFYLLCAATVGLGVKGAYEFRMRQIRDRFESMVEERMRVARDLHDTVLQGFSGVSFQLEAAFKLFDRAPDKAKQALMRAIEQSDVSLLEARQTISYLRLTALKNGFTAAVREIGQNLAKEKQIAFRLHTEGEVDQIGREAETIVYLAVRESIQNAIRHASPSSIEVLLKRDSSGLTAFVKDDGVGFDTASQATGNRWGLRGVRERANSIGAKLTVKSSPGSGTMVYLTVPASRLGSSIIKSG